jgi:hypothetical protein
MARTEDLILSQLPNILQRIEYKIDLLQQGQQQIILTVQKNQNLLNQVLNILTAPVPIAGTVITLEKTKMTKKVKVGGTTLDLQILDTGTATGTISFVDSLGEPTVPETGANVSTSVTTSDPGAVASIDSTGLIITISLASPAPNPLPVGVTVTAVTTVSNPDGTTAGPFTAVSPAFDFQAGGPAGTQIVLS